MKLREFIARENLYELTLSGMCGGGFSLAYVLKEAALFNLPIPENVDGKKAAKPRK